MIALFHLHSGSSTTPSSRAILNLFSWLCHRVFRSQRYPSEPDSLTTRLRHSVAPTPEVFRFLSLDTDAPLMQKQDDALT